MKKKAKNNLLKVILLWVLALFLFIFLPTKIIFGHFSNPLRITLLFYFINIIIGIFIIRSYLVKKYEVEHEVESLFEKSNLLTDENARDVVIRDSLKEKIRRYNNLKSIIEKINKNLDIDYVAEILSSVAFTDIANNKGTCLLYLVDNLTRPNLNLFKAKKEDKDLVIKSKEGDIFDSWVLRHNSPLLVENTSKDFRFDSEKIRFQEARIFSSVISAPLVSESKFLGVIRLDHPHPGYYSQDDLRLLTTIADLGAVALENAELYKKTQDLAIHDELTSLYTKGYFIERLNEETGQDISKGKVFSLLMIDIDYFKKYNDKFGHIAGDIVLQILSAKIMYLLKDFNPIISRFGGEEFCVVLPGVEKKKAYIAACDLCEKLENTRVVLRRQETNITVSVGVSSFPEDGIEAKALILKSDKAMYEAKQKGRNRVCLA